MSKRPGFSIGSITEKKARLENQTAVSGNAASSMRMPQNAYLSQPVQPETAVQLFLTQTRNAARQYLPKELRSSTTGKIETPFCEVEARLGVLTIGNRRVTSSGAKTFQGKPVRAFDCTRHDKKMVSGVSRMVFTKISELAALQKAFNVTHKQDLVETELVETVYTGYPNKGRLCYAGEHPPSNQNHVTQPTIGKMESKEKLMELDLTVPAANFDMRISLSSEKVMDANVVQPPPGWTSKRVKRRRSYARKDKAIAWQIDITEVTTFTGANRTVDFEVELEILPHVLLQLINEDDDASFKKMTGSLSSQLWWILTQINPLKDAVDVEESLQEHHSKTAVDIARAQCAAFRKFMHTGGQYESPIANPHLVRTSIPVAKDFVGCMPVNFSRHNLEEIQRSADNDYFLSEKTDGVRYFMVFTGDTVVLLDRTMNGKQPIPVSDKEPFAKILDLIQPGTVLDGEVVMNRKYKRPIFIVFDVLSISPTEPVLQLPFEQRLQHLRKATFRTKTASRDMFDPRMVADNSIALPLVRKNFVSRMGLDELLSNVVEERCMRCYQNGDLHNHLTDGIIFQPNRPYALGTDVHLLKWKYLDTVTVDVEIMPLLHNDDEDTLRVACMGDEQTRVDMTRYVVLPPCERARLEADKFEGGGRIAEVGFDPEVGEWYYLTIRGDKRTPNHISTVLGTLFELAESLTTDELRYRMSVPPGTRDNFRKDMKGMLSQLLDHQRRQLQQAKRQRPNR
jgi:hypothetical protein